MSGYTGHRSPIRLHSPLGSGEEYSREHPPRPVGPRRADRRPRSIRNRFIGDSAPGPTTHRNTGRMGILAARVMPSACPPEPARELSIVESVGSGGEPSGDNLTRKGRTNARPFFTSVFARGTQNCDVHHSTPLPTELTGKTEFRAHCELAAPGPEADFLMGCYDA